MLQKPWKIWTPTKNGAALSLRNLFVLFTKCFVNITKQQGWHSLQYFTNFFVKLLNLFVNITENIGKKALRIQLRKQYEVFVKMNIHRKNRSVNSTKFRIIHEKTTYENISQQIY